MSLQKNITLELVDGLAPKLKQFWRFALTALPKN